MAEKVEVGALGQGGGALRRRATGLAEPHQGPGVEGRHQAAEVLRQPAIWLMAQDPCGVVRGPEQKGLGGSSLVAAVL